MNENNQPQSQQTKREPGYYWVKMEGFQWRIAGWNGSEWTVPGSLSVFGDDWFEIDERRIERGDVNFEMLKYITKDQEKVIVERDKRIKELEAMIEQFTYYGLIHTVNGVVPVDYDSHEDLIKKAKLIFQKQP